MITTPNTITPGTLLGIQIAVNLSQSIEPRYDTRGGWHRIYHLHSSPNCTDIAMVVAMTDGVINYGCYEQLIYVIKPTEMGWDFLERYYTFK